METGVDQISISGRYRRTTSEEELARRYHIPIPQQRDLPISWNMAPTEDVLAIRFNPESKQRTLDVVCLQELKAPDAAFPINDIHAAGYGAIWHWQSTFSGGTFLHWFRCTTPTLSFPVIPTRSVDSNYPFARQCKHLKRIGPLRSGRVLRQVLQTFREEDPLDFHDPARSLFNSSQL